MSSWGFQVMWLVLGAVSVAAVVVFVGRLLLFRRVMVDYSDFLKGVYNILSKGNVDEALAVCDEARGPVSAVLQEAIKRREDSLEVLHDAMRAVGQEELSRYERRIGVLILGVQLSPLLGLIGSLLGIRQAARLLVERAPVLDANLLYSAVSGSISVTVGGLVVAAGCYVMYHVLSELLDRMRQDLNLAASDVFRYFAEARGAGK